MTFLLYMPVNEVLFACLQSNEYFTAAKLDELKKWENFKVYDEVKGVSQNYLTGRWVCAEKITNEAKIPKARFIVQVFQEKTNIQADSPTGLHEDGTDDDCCHKWLDTPCYRYQISFLTRETDKLYHSNKATS